MPNQFQNDFSINNVQLDSQIQSQDFASRVVNNANGGRTNLVQKITEFKRNNSAKNVLRFPLDTPKYYMTMEISEYSRNDLFTVNFSTKNTIILPLPDRLIDSGSVNYEPTSIGTGLGAATNFLSKNIDATSGSVQNDANGLNQILKENQNLTEEQRKTIDEAIKKIGTIGGGVITDALNNTPGIRELFDPVKAILGISPNQFFTILLRSPQYSTYQLSWKFLPKNLKESENINEIIIQIKNAKSPGLYPGGLFWKFPKIFRLAYYPNSQYLGKFKPSVITDVSVNYSSSGNHTFYATKSGKPNPPEAVMISATFLELEYWLEGDYKNNNNPFDTMGTPR